MSAIYSLDTSAILGMFLRRFPPDVVPSFWSVFDELVLSGGAVCIDLAHHELKQQSDEPEEWVAARPTMVRAMSPGVFARAAQIVQVHYPAQYLSGRRSQADPFVIALAQEEGLVVVSDEQSDPRSRIPKIPDLCAKLGVDHVDVFGLARRQGWRF